MRGNSQQAPDSNRKANIGQCSVPGTRYGALNQDYTLVRELSTHGDSSSCTQSWAAAVLDGHGMLGELVAQETGQHVLEEVIEKAAEAGPGNTASLERVMLKAFKHAHEAALKLYSSLPEVYTYPVGSRSEELYKLTYVEGLPMYKSMRNAERLVEFGTTCTVAHVDGKNLLIANVGDSSAVLGSRQDDGSYAATEITVRHWGHNPEEASRINSSKSGRVEILQDDGYISVAAGRFKGYQLSMTRALGHSMLADFGVITTPSVTHRQLTPSDACLILASDGVWDAFTPAEAVELVMDIVEEGGSPSKAAMELCNEAVLRSVEGPDGEADNTSAVVAVFATSGGTDSSIDC